MKLKSVLIIGAGHFGRHCALKFNEIGKEVMVVDSSEDRIKELMPTITNAVIGDCTREDVLRTLGVNQFDLCIVAVGGDHFGSSLEVTLLLKELGAKYVIAKATRDIHEKFLHRSGADEVIYPEKMMAEKLVMRYNAANIFNYIELNPDFSVLEVPVNRSWVGKTVGELDVRSNFHVNILATKVGDVIVPLTSPSHRFTAGEHLYLFGRTTDVMKLLDK